MSLNTAFPLLAQYGAVRCKGRSACPQRRLGLVAFGGSLEEGAAPEDIFLTPLPNRGELEAASIGLVDSYPLLSKQLDRGFTSRRKRAYAQSGLAA